MKLLPALLFLGTVGCQSSAKLNQPPPKNHDEMQSHFNQNLAQDAPQTAWCVIKSTMNGQGRLRVGFGHEDFRYTNTTKHHCIRYRSWSSIEALPFAKQIEEACEPHLRKATERINALKRADASGQYAAVKADGPCPRIEGEFACVKLLSGSHEIIEENFSDTILLSNREAQGICEREGGKWMAHRAGHIEGVISFHSSHGEKTDAAGDETKMPPAAAGAGKRVPYRTPTEEEILAAHPLDERAVLDYAENSASFLKRVKEQKYSGLAFEFFKAYQENMKSDFSYQNSVAWEFVTKAFSYSDPQLAFEFFKAYQENMKSNFSYQNGVAWEFVTKVFSYPNPQKAFDIFKAYQEGQNNKYYYNQSSAWQTVDKALRTP